MLSEHQDRHEAEIGQHCVDLGEHRLGYADEPVVAILTVEDGQAATARPGGVVVVELPELVLPLRQRLHDLGEGKEAFIAKQISAPVESKNYGFVDLLHPTMRPSW